MDINDEMSCNNISDQRTVSESFEVKPTSEDVSVNASKSEDDFNRAVEETVKQKMIRLTNQQIFDKAMHEKAERDQRIYSAFREKQIVFRGCGLIVS